MNINTFSHWLLLLSPLLFAFTIPMDDDNFNFYLSTERVFSPSEGNISVSLSGNMQKSTTFSFKAYRVTDPVEFFLAQKDPHTLDLGDDDDDTTTQSKRRRPVWSKYKIVAEWKQTVKSNRYSWFNETVKAPLRESGVYLVVASAREKQAAAVLVVSTLGMITKQADGTALAFVMDRTNGQRGTNVPLTFMRGGRTLATVNTGSSGMAQISVPDIPEQTDGDDEPYYYRYGNGLVVMGEKGGEFVISDSYFYGYYRGRNNNVQTYLHTDRPVYRPAQKVFYRGIARQVQPDGTFKLIASDTVQVEVSDARGTVINRDTVTLSDFGTFSGELTLGDEPPLGNYSIRTTINGATGYFSFEVQEYKKPEYEVTVATDKSQYTRGDKITATVKADYYFGSPVAEGEVEYSIYRSRYWRPWWYRTEWAYLYEEKMSFPQYGMEMVHNGTGTLNSDGTFTIDYATDGKADQDYVYQVQAKVVDASRRAITGATSVKVTRGEFFITTRTDKYLYKPNEEIALTVQINTFDGDKPVAASFKTRVLRTWWEYQKRGRSERHEETIWTGSGSTGQDGTGTIRIPAGKSGYYNVEVTAADSRGTAITETTYIYVAQEGYAWYNDGSGDIQIIPDKDLYKPGETMSALVVMPAENLDVLVTGEGATIYGAQVERLNGRSAIVRMKIEDRQAPVFYLAVASIANDQLYSHQQRITVAPVGKRLRIEVKTDKPQYKPGETGTITLRARNEQGEPAATTDIAVGIVDEAIYAIRPESAPDIQKFFYGERGNEVSTNTSLYFRFSTRSVEGFAVAEGNADSSFEVRGGRAAPMMAKRATKDGESAESYVQPTLRKDFQDLMFWTPSVRTDASGRATLTVKFPDNLTTWRITARGVTQATAVGQTTTEVIARKDLLARMEVPRFITAGDRLKIATTIHNYLATEKRTKVQFLAEGVQATERERTITIAPNGEASIDWEITAPNAGEAKLTVRALTDEESDAMELRVPVLPLGIKQSVAGIADLDDRTPSGTITLLMPNNADPLTGTLTLNLSPSPASSLLGALDDLIGYPYGCVEQTMSRFLPTVVVADALKKLDVPFDAKKREELPKMVAKGLNRLYELQHDDGGWGWWENDKTNAFMTAYVIYGMEIARQAGYAVEARRLEQGSGSLNTMIASNDSPDDKTIDPTTRAWMLYVAAMQQNGDHDNGLKSRIEKLARRNDLNNYARALLAMAATNQGEPGVAGKLFATLEKEVTQTQTGAFWKGTTWHYNWQDDQVETTAWVLKAMLETRGENDLTRKATRWLLTQKQGSSWGNTRQTAMVVFALADHLKATNQLDPDMTITARVNGKQVASQRITKADLFKQEITVTVPANELSSGENRVELTRTGKGTLYATARLSYYATGKAIKPADAGFTVTRQYWTLERVREGKKYIYKKREFKGTVTSGQELFVKVTVTPNAGYDYFMLEDPLPAGCEVVTETSGYEIPGESGYGGGNDDGGYRPWMRGRIWNWWYADRDVRDEKVSFFSTRIESREYEFSYILRAQIPGSYAVMPAVGALMYYPEVRGNSGVVNLKIQG